MKVMTIKTLLLTSLIIISLCQYEENKYLCKENNIISYKCSAKCLLKDKCMSSKKTITYDEYGYDEAENNIHYLTDCDGSTTCKTVIFDNEVVENNEPQYGICVEREIKGFEGDKCKYNGECFSMNCLNKKCSPIPDGSSCLNLPYGCSKASACITQESDNSDICQRIVGAGEACTHNDMCPLDYACGQIDTSSKKCIKMFSIATGGKTTNSLLCQSGAFFFNGPYLRYYPHIEDFEIDSTVPDPTFPKCAEVSSASTALTCKLDSDCKYKVDDKTPDEIYEAEGSCSCGSQGTVAYCEPGTDNQIWKDWIAVYQEEIKEVELDDIKSMQYARHNQWLRPRLVQAYANKKNFAKFKDADECTVRYLTNSHHLHTTFLIFLFAFILI